ncbi:sulfotransferase 2B1-like [Electrophorus electricus]|uniref:sulfotransferase 2B1-like n=1 Tax=Electrophorus electricus TaxID=8005 RepID=UPI0015D0989A|nr:sulfotransferase 2B1-like [Electrophorus electricus]
MENEKYLTYHGLMCPKKSHSEDNIKDFKTFKVQEDDVFVITYPKSGTVWMQEIIPLLLNGGDFTPVQTIPNWERVPWLEATPALFVDKMISPRAMVSHMPYHLMPSSFFSSKAKIIYITRDPRDVLVSSFHFHRMANFLDNPGTFEEFAAKFLAGKVFYGKWADHVKSWRNPDIGDRILYIKYEEMIQVSVSIRTIKLAISLGQELQSYQEIAGDWKNHFSPELEAKFIAAINEEMKGYGIRFYWDEEENEISFN